MLKLELVISILSINLAPRIIKFETFRLVSHLVQYFVSQWLHDLHFHNRRSNPIDWNIDKYILQHFPFKIWHKLLRDVEKTRGGKFQIGIRTSNPQKKLRVLSTEVTGEEENRPQISVLHNAQIFFSIRKLNRKILISRYSHQRLDLPSVIRLISCIRILP